jgi:TFIIF-interacting CTD phosphatase-like protein
MIVGDKVVHERQENNLQKLNLLLDLDSTIIYSIKHKNNNNYNFNDFNNETCLSVLCEHFTKDSIYQIHVRNNFADFLLELNNHFNIYIYTMATFDYASTVCDSIENILKIPLFSGIIARHGDHIGQFKYFYSLKHLNENNTIVIDDNTDVWIDDHKKNLIKIKRFKYISFEEYLEDKNLSILQNLILNFIDDMKSNDFHETIKTINICYQDYK